MDPVLRQLARLVQPGWHRAGPGPRHRRSGRPRVLTAEDPGDLRPRPPQQVSNDARTEPPRGADPFGLQLIQPGHELRLRRAARTRCAVVALAVAGQQPEIVADQVAAQTQDAPSRARRGPLPVRGQQAGEQPGQPVPLNSEQAGIIARRFGGRPGPAQPRSLASHQWPVTVNWPALKLAITERIPRISGTAITRTEEPEPRFGRIPAPAYPG